MTERPTTGPQQPENQRNRLTSPSANTYANNGVLSMATENTNENNPPQNWDPIDTQLNSENTGDISATTPEQIRARAAWRREYGGQWPTDPTAQQSLRQMIAGGEMPVTPGEGRRSNPRDNNGNPENQRESHRNRYNAPSLSGPETTSRMSEEEMARSKEVWNSRMEEAISRGMGEFNKDDDWYKSMGKMYESYQNVNSNDMGPLSSEHINFRQQDRDYDARKGAIEFLKKQGFQANEITEEQILLTMEQVQEQMSVASRIERIKDQIRKTDDLQTALNSFAQIRNYVKEIVLSTKGDKPTLRLKAETQRTLEEIVALKDADLTTIEAVRAQVARIMSDTNDGINVKKFFLEPEANARRGSRFQPRSLEELVELIAESQGGEFQAGGEFEIMNERGEIQLQNLVAWIRQRILAAHGADPDSPINTFNRIQIPAGLTRYSLDDMLFIPSFFQKRRLVVSGNEETGKITMKQESFDDPTYENFKLSLLYEAWLFGISHTNAAEYNGVRGQEEPLFNMLAKNYSKNEFTKDRNRFLNIFNLAKVDSVELGKVNDKEIQGSVGKAIQRATMAYYNLWELAREDEYHKKKDGVEERDNNGKRKRKKDNTSAAENSFYATLGEDGTGYFYHSMIEQLVAAKRVRVPNANGVDEASEFLSNNIKSVAKNHRNEEHPELANLTDLEVLFRHDRAKYDEVMAQFGITDEKILDRFDDDPQEIADLLLAHVYNGIKHADLNIFDKVDKRQEIIDLVRKSISSAVGRKEGLGVQDTEYAGEWAYTMRNWTGIAARNDTGGIGFDAWSKLINFQDYRGRQGRGRSGAGNLANFPGFKRLGVTLLDGLEVNLADGSKKTLANVLQDSIRENMRLKIFDFNGEAMRQFSANHINNTFKVYEFIMDKMEINMSSLVEIDHLGRAVFNHEAGQKIMDGIWHDLRYAFDQPRFNYEKTTVEGWENQIQYDKKGKPIFNETTGEIETKLVKLGETEKNLRHYMFGEEMIKLGHKMHHRKITHGKENEPKFKIQMARSAFAYLIAKEIGVHRDWGSGYVQWPIECVELVEQFFHHQALEFGQTSKTNTKMKIFETFFDHHEWKEILKLAKSTYGWALTKEGLVQGGAVLASTLFKAITGLVSEVGTVAKR